MAGGIMAWEGLVADGWPEVDLAYFRKASTPQEHVALAWHLEDGNRIFYREVSGFVPDAAAAALFAELAEAEEGHQETLRAVFEALAGAPEPEGAPPAVFAPGAGGGLMEGGLRLKETLAWARPRPARAIVELALSMEVNAYDRYLVLQRELEDENAARAFEILASEERRHLQRFMGIFEGYLRGNSEGRP